MTLVAKDSMLHTRVRQALDRISSVREMDGRLLVDVPVRYPSGSCVVLEVSRNQDDFWISDMGMACVEAELMAAQGYFTQSAKKSAERYSVGFDGHAIFTLRVPSGRLEAAIVCVANASQFACEEAIRKASEAQAIGRNDRIFNRVAHVFGSKFVERTAEIRGRHTSWEAHNVVIFPNRRMAVFEAMTNHPTSVSSKFLMFSDIRSASEDVALNVVVNSVSALDAKAQMIADLANILSLDIDDDDIRTYANAS